MTLHLPPCLPPEAVDEMLDNELVFYWDEWTCEYKDPDGIYVKGVTYATPYARRKTMVVKNKVIERENISNFGRAFFEVTNDVPKAEEDEDGYMHWGGYSGSRMDWTAEELSEEQIDAILGGVI